MPRRLLALSVVVAAGLLAACGSSSSGSPAAEPKSSPAASSESSPAASSAAGGAALKIASFDYDPKPLTVKPGQVVDVSNSDSAEHTVTSDMKGLFVADDVKQGATITFKAPTKPGTYTFHCQYHPNMHGTLVVAGG